MSKLFFLFCSIFGCRSNDLLGISPRTSENGTDIAHFCNDSGRFPNPLDMNCQSYILCLTDENGEYVAEMVSCPNGMIFNATRGRCVKESAGFLCPHICEEYGRIPYRKIDCQHYVWCVPDSDGKMKAELGQCPNGTWYCGEYNKCLPGPADACVIEGSTTVDTNTSTNWTTQTTTIKNKNFTVETNETTVDWETTTDFMSNTTIEEVTQNPGNVTDPWTNTTTSTIKPTTNDPTDDDFHFTCNRIGRFPISGICNQYILCVQGVNGEWIMSLEKCPKGRVFSTTRLRCVTI